MGIPIAINLIEAGYHLRIYNRTSEKISTLISSLSDEQRSQVVGVSSPHQSALKRDSIVVSIVVNDIALEEIVNSLLEEGESNEGDCTGIGNGGIHLCLSTVSAEITARMTQLHEEKGVSYVSCPVFGRPPFAAAKKTHCCSSRFC